MAANLIIFLVFLSLIFVFFFAVKKGRTVPSVKRQSKKPTPRINRDFVIKKWQEIDQTFALGGPSHFKSAILEADKLVDFVLKAKGVKGETMGDRLKNAKSKFEGYSDYENLWFARKVRNSIAHDSEYELNSAEAKKAIRYFEQALKVLEALPW